jgi:DNA-directed RNA polymerase subunit RPC12/RpoP
MELLKDLGMIYITPTSKQKRRYGTYRCPDCSKEVTVQQYDVRSGHSTRCKSCSLKTHGKTDHVLYNTWKNERRRCTTKTNPQYKDYGGRGISIDKAFDSFDVWLQYVLSLDSSMKVGYTIDRIDNDGNYTFGNLRWVSNNIQRRNTRVIQSNNKSGFRGVCWCNTKHKFKAYITVNSKRISLGYHEVAMDAAKAYDGYVINHNLEHNINGVINDSRL